MKSSLLFSVVIVGTIACGYSLIVPSVISAQESEIHVSALDLADDSKLDRSLTRTNFSLGTIGNSTLLYSVRAYRYAILNAFQTEDIVYRGNTTTRLRAIRATEIGTTQFARAYLLSGGLNSTNATVRLQSAVSYGYNYVVDFWG